MNNVPVEVDYRGVALTDNVDTSWLLSVTPRYYDEYIKFVVNTATNTVYLGMDIHADCVAPGEAIDAYFGGNIFFDDWHIEYESTLNIPKNEAIEGFTGNPRMITDAGLIERINGVLFAWVKGLGERA